ncbi:hypothetical protein MSAN_01898600 [Mycena sanguinolenta]|uniref:Uncharacterized protein n=1 Tax=Mycena sanguinolenta TaxID=230812 RepID=A0A8H7CPD4_9AGAR|nr:hypothetical protein MSAN_01898600 [Mycena sanguinolenta]
MWSRTGSEDSFVLDLLPLCDFQNPNARTDGDTLTLWANVMDNSAHPPCSCRDARLLSVLQQSSLIYPSENSHQDVILDWLSPINFFQILSSSIGNPALEGHFGAMEFQGQGKLSWYQGLWTILVPDPKTSKLVLPASI